MFEHYTNKARRALFFARHEACELGSAYVETEHLLLGLMREDTPFSKRIFKSGVALEVMRGQVEANSPCSATASGSLLTPKKKHGEWVTPR
jgi:ATP-dependent Clp protease ATP-binding subunit ClpC